MRSWLLKLVCQHNNVKLSRSHREVCKEHHGKEAWVDIHKCLNFVICADCGQVLNASGHRPEIYPLEGLRTLSAWNPNESTPPHPGFYERAWRQEPKPYAVKIARFYWNGFTWESPPPDPKEPLNHHPVEFLRWRPVIHN